MFTVKQIDALGNVRLRACADATIEADGGMIWVRAYDDGGKEIAVWSGWPSSDREEDMIYIMNTNGATIHSLRFRPSAASTLKPNNSEASATDALNARSVGLVGCAG